MKQIDGGITTVPGIQAAGIHAGIKKAELKDLALIVTDAPAAAAGVFTKNSVTAAPVLVCRQHLSDSVAQAIIINSGNANACTGELGMSNAQRMASTTAEQLGIDENLVLVSSTGVIGQQLPMDKIENGIQLAANALSTEGGAKAAEAIMTTDTHPKSAAVEMEIDGKAVRIGGIAKGSGMIAPNMATMLSYLTTDVRINSGTLQSALTHVVDNTYNLLTVDTDRSTNDTVIILATANAENTKIVEAKGTHYEAFCEGLQFVCTELVKMLARDGEGATKLVEVVVKHAKNRSDAEKAARAVAESPLVKTAVFANDANWGRIMMAIGKSGAEFDAYQVDVLLADYPLVKNGMDAGYDEEKATQLFDNDPVRITIDLRAGDTEITMWTCDYSYDYIRINADYRT
ncbi:MAG: bifunctional glutamate N-acetyltransferase/amino-acid acetyltransferase ArgJ [Candidatus Poribacteria bacterium]|nr:bifunctional glutamate N-acetyltransferase/amino-acid acetyltransferase ArgJ [Candidatus Poribacteria bacterium]